MISYGAHALAIIIVLLAVDWLIFGRLAAFHPDKEAAYRLPIRRGIVLIAFAIYTYWALVSRDYANRLPPAFLIPVVVGVVAWLLILIIDLKASLIDRQEE